MSEQRCFLVTGASKGIGRAISLALIDAGARVLGVGRDFSDWSSLPGRFTPLHWDLADLKQLPERLGDLRKRYPEPDGLVLNAGYGRFGALEQFSDGQIQHMIAVNLTQHLLITRALLPAMKKRRRGRNLIMGSEAALRGGRNGAIYAACKFGLRGFAQSLRQETARAGIGVTLINPGMVRSDFFDGLKFRPGPGADMAIETDRIAQLALTALLSPDSGVIDEINLSPQQHVIEFD